jgi:nitrate/nitrite transporter NarK
MQEVQRLSPLHIAVELLPQALAGFIWSYIGQALVSKIAGKIIMGIGGIAYLVGATLQIFVKQDTNYWLLLFPSLCITVIGTDFQFIVSNVGLSSYTTIFN